MALLLQALRKVSVEEEVRVRRASVRVGVELRRKEGQDGVDDALVGAVVSVGEEGRPLLGEAPDLDLVAVVLGGDVALAGEFVDESAENAKLVTAVMCPK